jgi:hypothetical protein
MLAWRRRLDLRARKRSDAALDGLVNDERPTAGFHSLVFAPPDPDVDLRSGFAGYLLGLFNRDGDRFNAAAGGHKKRFIA